MEISVSSSQYVVDVVCKTLIVGLFFYYLLKWTGILAIF